MHGSTELILQNVENSSATAPTGPGYVSGVAREDDAWIVPGAAARVGGSHVCSCSELYTECAECHGKMSAWSPSAKETLTGW